MKSENRGDRKSKRAFLERHKLKKLQNGVTLILKTRWISILSKAKCRIVISFHKDEEAVKSRVKVSPSLVDYIPK